MAKKETEKTTEQLTDDTKKTLAAWGKHFKNEGQALGAATRSEIPADKEFSLSGYTKEIKKYLDGVI